MAKLYATLYPLQLLSQPATVYSTIFIYVSLYGFMHKSLFEEKKRKVKCYIATGKTLCKLCLLPCWMLMYTLQHTCVWLHIYTHIHMCMLVWKVSTISCKLCNGTVVPYFPLRKRSGCLVITVQKYLFKTKSKRSGISFFDIIRWKNLFNQQAHFRISRITFH